MIVSPGPNWGCCLPVANASSATLIKSIFLFNLNVNNTRNIHKQPCLVRDYENRCKDNAFFPFMQPSDYYLSIC